MLAMSDLFADKETCSLPYCHTCLASLVPNPWGPQLPHGDTRWPTFTSLQCDAQCATRDAQCATRDAQSATHDAQDGQEACPAVYCSRLVT